MMNRWISGCAAVAFLVMPVAALAAQPSPGAVILSDGSQIPQMLHRGALHLTGAQRAQIREAVEPQDTQVSNKSAQGFTPAVGAKLPKGVKGLGLPQGLLERQPQLANYGYVKMKDQVLIVNEMTHTIVDLISQT